MEHETVETNSVHVYKYRWIILLIYCLYAGVNFLQFLQYSIINNITAKYYNVDGTMVDLTGLIFLINFVVLCLPVNYLIEKYNLRITAIGSSALTTCGNLIKLLSVSPDRFYVAFISQFLCAVGQVFMLCIPSKLASTWFGPEEVSTACAIAIFGTQIGVGLGSIFPSNLVRNNDDSDAIGHDFMTMAIINASVTTAIFILVVLFFRARPPLPPSLSQVDILEAEKLSIWPTLKSLAKNKNYLLLLVAFGSCNGMYTCFGIIISEVYRHYFPGYDSEVGIICAIAVIAGGCIGSVVFGYILDKWHHFKITSFFVMFASSITYIFIAVSLELKGQLATYFTIPIFGFFIASTLLVGFEFATEVTYPIPEATSCGILNSIIYLFSIVYTLVFEALFDVIGYIAVHCIVVVILALSSLVVFLVSPVLRRREANFK